MSDRRMIENKAQRNIVMTGNLMQIELQRLSDNANGPDKTRMELLCTTWDTSLSQLRKETSDRRYAAARKAS